MATQIITQVVPFPAVSTAVEQITQLEILALLSLRGRLSQIEKQVADAEQSIKSRLESGCEVELGDHSASLKENFRRSISWRDVAERLAAKLYGPRRAEAYCSNVLENTKTSRSVSLVVL